MYLLLTERFDADPFLLFTLRGRTQDKVLTALQAERGGAKPARKAAASRVTPEPEAPKAIEPRLEIFVPLGDAWADFWRTRTLLEELLASVTPAALPDAWIRALEEPAFWSGPGRLRDHLSAVYQAMTRDALILSGAEGQPLRSARSRS